MSATQPPVPRASVPRASVPRASALARAPKPRDLRLLTLLATVGLMVVYYFSFRAVEFAPLQLWRNRANMADKVNRGMPPTGFPSVALVDPADPDTPPLVRELVIPPNLEGKARDLWWERELAKQPRAWAWDWGAQELRVYWTSPKDEAWLRTVFVETIRTMQIALIGSSLAALICLPMSFLAAANIASPRAVAVNRFLFNLTRSIDVLVIAIIFVAATGAGVFAGTLAIIIHSIGNLGKMFADAVEEVEHGQLEALQAVGARGNEVIRWAIIPQVLPLWISYFLYRFEINVRLSVVLGLVGAGGIGAILNQVRLGGEDHKLWSLSLIIVFLVMALDGLSNRLRSLVH